MKSISITTFHDLLQKKPDKKIFFIDVRSPGEYKSEHIEGVGNYPLDTIEQSAKDLKKYTSVYVHCNSGSRSDRACSTLENLGLKNLINVEGGIQAWKAKRLPTVKGKGAISIMRQVRITAGALVLLGAILAEYYHPSFIWLSGLAGAGLLYSGLSDSCMMGMVLSKMPWNK